MWQFNHSPPVTERRERDERKDVTSCVQTKPYRSWGDMWNVLKTVLGNENLFLVRVYMNLYPFGAEALAHTDSDRDDEITALVPIHASWHHDWGGETVLIDRFGDVTRSVLPYPGRALVFRSNILHSARPVTRSCPLARRMLVFKAASWPAGQVLRARQPDMLDGAGPPAEPGPGVSTTFWEHAANDPRARTAAALQWVQSSKAAWMRHGAGTLAGHLAATAGWLQAWNADEKTVRAGLCHAMFGTAIYSHAALDIATDRPVAEQVFGRESVHVGLLFAAIDRASLRNTTSLIAQGTKPTWPLQLTAAKSASWAPEAANPVVEDEATMNALMMIAAANECAQLGRWNRIEEALSRHSADMTPEQG